ncbi:MAG: hypothetical protein LW768_19565 [Rubrivivax sp.]|nr:hypothetical protein [Rubrivivax sp.]
MNQTTPTGTTHAAPDTTRAATDVDEFINALDGGMVAQKLSVALSKAAAAAMDHDEKSEVTIKLTFERLSGTFQCRVEHELKFRQPTMDGETSEKEKRATVLWVGRYGRLSMLPPDVTRGGQATLPNT